MRRATALPLPPALALVLALIVAAVAAPPARPQAATPAVPSATPDPQDPEALWAAGQRRAALELLEAQLAAAPHDDLLRVHVAGRLAEVGRWQATLDTLLPLQAPARPDLSAVVADETARLLGTAYYMLSRYEEALPLLADEGPLQGILRADALLALGRTEEARAALADLRERHGADTPGLDRLLGQLLVAEGAHAEAVPAFRAALARDPLDRTALFGLGQALLRTGAREEGLALLERHRALLPLLDKRDFALQSLGLDENLAGNHAQVGDVERELLLLDSAEARYRRAEELAQPDELVAIVLRHARLLAEDRDDPDGAVALLDAAARRVPDVRLAVRAGDVLLAAGRAAEAVPRFEQALAARPQDGQLRQRLDAARAAAAGSEGAPR